jgi:hypothetical protein
MPAICFDAVGDTFERVMVLETFHNITAMAEDG